MSRAWAMEEVPLGESRLLSVDANAVWKADLRGDVNRKNESPRFAGRSLETDIFSLYERRDVGRIVASACAG